MPLLVALIFLPFAKTQSIPSNLSSLVNLHIGTVLKALYLEPLTIAGNVLPGAALPFGIVKVGIDTIEFSSPTDTNA